MPELERIREFLQAVPPADYFERKLAQGWKLVAVDWDRPTGQPAVQPARKEEVPFGLEIADDCEHLQENSIEKNALMFIMDLVVKDVPLTRISDELNRNGYRNRDGALWTPGQVFDLLPRLVDVGPRILTNREYIARKHSSAGA